MNKVVKVSAEKRDELHKKITLWLVRCRRPLTLPQHDTEFKEIFACIFRGSYTPPCYQLVIHNILQLSAEGKARLQHSLKELLAEAILPCIAGDIWSQGGIAIFGILVYWLDKNFVVHEKLIASLPFSTVRHTGLELEKATKKACSEFGVGQYVLESDGDVPTIDTVADFVHATCSDNASNIVSGWVVFDGHECADHSIALCVKTFLDQPGMRKVFMKLRGMTAHFNHSVIGAKLLKQCQDRHKLPESKPPQDNDTRSGWGGAYNQAQWYYRNQMYDVENLVKAATAVPNPDGSVYKQHQLVGDEWDIVRESMHVLMYANQAVDILQSTKRVTANLYLPVIGRLAHIAHEDDTRLKFEGQSVFILNEEVKKARKMLYNDVVRRFFNQLQDCKLEDFAVATLLDPRSTQVLQVQVCGQEVAGNEDAAPAAKKRKVQSESGIVTAASFLGDSDSDEECDIPSLVEEIVPETELDRYLALPYVKKDVDIQEWWKSQAFNFPRLSQMARQFLGAPASTAGVERAFSAVTGMHSDLRKCLEEGTIQHSLMAAMN
ncbi:hypothetical protein CYMTET_56443 [Cymbomonas tetramitiformis]|uniref:HAT C-terminal dimerisation domain-containing protein n=1 Tax=Cymbomonas tetramitiformis TaxID=36881 RepID=A0AAE0BB95_9CHLO|nr:hypothetical protein CYMTET_56443 [Cymbomonas tetramitiformis]